MSAAQTATIAMHQAIERGTACCRGHAASAGRPDGGEFPRLGQMIDDDRDFLNADRLELGLQWVLDGIAAPCER